MPKKSCAPGYKWDSLLQVCMPRDLGHQMPTEPFLTNLVRMKNMPAADQTVVPLKNRPTADQQLVRLKNTPPADQTVVQLKNSPPADQKGAVFIPQVLTVVLLITLASLVALTIWLVIYRRHKRQSTEEVPPEHPLLKTDPPHCVPPSEGCSTLLHTATVWQEGVSPESESTEHEGRDWSGLKGSAVRQETVPLPATELVTTKTLPLPATELVSPKTL
ncbi:uncharacterized protein LOC110162429 [Boleophthalmus pectinirostris]|uniref:uncharacterized protein LOC110162429 n=1 Tax=Boleophthalmus pectinirostris TaxID=150288 RepID=UPI000A1C37A7|nr:uncharacterized protein LOC110162429 [Boleophthalmus pectinirostris]